MGLLASIFVRNESMDRGNNAKRAFQDDEKRNDVGVV
jgi:hypothetical protein